jgi:hypothetical protein
MPQEDMPRPNGALAVQVRPDTQAVDPDQGQLETPALLRHAQVLEVHARGRESPEGRGYHCQGILTCLGPDGSGTPLLSPEANSFTLILRGIGGVSERVFRWQPSLG